MSFVVDNIEDLMPLYYKRLFPFSHFYKWLNYANGNNRNIENREFSVTLSNDVYVRYLSFESLEDFQREICKLSPFKIDIGAVYNHKPRDHRTKDLQPVEKELVFDIDMTDYDDVRTCCSGTDVCVKCWKYLALACKIIDATLRIDFNFKHILWVFSGRRGIHCWVCDECARKLDINARGAVAEYLQLLSGGDKSTKKIYLISDIMYPPIRRSVGIIKEHFVQICLEEQDILGTDRLCEKFLNLISDANMKSDLEAEFSKNTSSLDRWQAFVTVVERHTKIAGKRQVRHAVEEIMLQYVYPRLDINVTKGINHLLKAPFCIHPKTGKVCVPFLARNVFNFDLSAVPTISTLMDEITEYDKKTEAASGENKNSMAVQDYKKTRLNRSVAIFQEFLKSLHSSELSKIRKLADESMEF